MKKRIIPYIVIIVFLVLCITYRCKTHKRKLTLKAQYALPQNQWIKPHVDSGVVWKEITQLPNFKNKLNEEEVALGEKLFFDKRLSKSNKVSCASCHKPNLSWQDGLEKSPGHDSLLGDRNTQSILNIVYFKTFFWDGRAKTLEEQVKGPLTNSKEMNNNIDELLSKINDIEEYKVDFKKVYQTKEIQQKHLFKAIATFEKTIVNQTTRFDQFLQGDTTAMNNREIRGLHLFRTKGRCMNCHHGALFSDQKFHNLGLVYYKREYEDLGLYQITKKAKDVGKFRTPTLRNVINTGPWMHNGFVWEIEGVMSMYNAGMVQSIPTEEEKKDSLYPYTSKLLKPLNLTREEQEEIIAFLQCLNTY